jgi:hypothetical protein
MTSASPRAGSTAAQGPKHTAAQGGILRVRVPRAQGPSFPVPQ